MRELRPRGPSRARALPHTRPATPARRATAARVRRVVATCCLLLGVLGLTAGPSTAQDATGQDPSPAGENVVDVVEAIGVLDSPLITFITSGVEGAAADGAQAVVIQLDASGSLGADVAGLVDVIRESPIPVVVYVGQGARITGDAVRVAAASHVLALAPTSLYGQSHPADLGQPDAITPDAVADLLVPLGEATSRSTEFLASTADGAAVIAVPDGESGVAIAEQTTLPTGVDADLVRTLDEKALRDAGIAEIVAPTLQQALAAISGLEVQTAAGDRTIDIDPATANVRFINLNLVQRILHTASSPVLAYLLLLAGALAFFFELFQPGFGVSGFSAIGVFALGVYSMAVLPISLLWAAVAVIGMLGLAYDLAVADLSWPSALGTVLLGAGSIQMWQVSELAPPTWLLVVGTIGAALFFILLLTSVLRAQGNQALLGAKAIEGKVGIVRVPLNPDGHIFVGGALWRARAAGDAGRVNIGQKVRVLGLNDSLTLDVELVEDEAGATV